jgi:predicted house-cleaning noncanonical NTP pyrophosphatase (MazG superfamily)
MSEKIWTRRCKNMESIVSGKIPKHYSNTEEVKNQLQELGYAVSETSNYFEFKKEGSLENALEEVSPICEEAGLSKEKELTLEETYPDMAMSSVYDHGRIVRKLPGY